MFSASRGFGHCLRINCGHPLDTRIDAALSVLGRLATAHG
jgi:DNA-binding transcriptional MocR family regulator